MSMKILITGGAGFIGSALVRHLLQHSPHQLVNLDKLTYAANPASLTAAKDQPHYRFVHGDIADAPLVGALLNEVQPDAIVNLAAETHVDRSIDAPAEFVQTNILGTCILLDQALRYWQGLDPARGQKFRFLQVSSDEVFGSLQANEPAWREDAPLAPRSPYAASKASADLLVQAWHHTYGLPVVITRSSNNYGPCQFPEKLVPHILVNALLDQPLPVYGDGLQVRDWLHVDDHARALEAILVRGAPGATYNISANNPSTNLDLVQRLCDLLDEMAPGQRAPGRTSYRELITHVDDRPGHDRRYALDASCVRDELGWSARHTLDDGLRDTVRWYLDNPHWWQPLLGKHYQLGRLGLGSAASHQKNGRAR